MKITVILGYLATLTPIFAMDFPLDNVLMRNRDIEFAPADLDAVLCDLSVCEVPDIREPAALVRDRRDSDLDDDDEEKISEFAIDQLAQRYQINKQRLLEMLKTNIREARRSPTSPDIAELRALRRMMAQQTQPQINPESHATQLMLRSTLQALAHVEEESSRFQHKAEQRVPRKRVIIGSIISNMITALIGAMATIAINSNKECP